MDLIDINKKKGFPRSYHFNQFLRWFTLLLGLFAFVYSFFYIFTVIGLNTSNVKKAIPFIILFLAINSLLKNLFSLNKITFREDRILFKFIARKAIIIYWKEITGMSFVEGRQKFIKIAYERDAEKKTFDMSLSFPNMVEIVNSIAELCHDIEYDDFLQKVIISEQEKNLMKLRPIKFKGNPKDES